jgi:hypothetical protein
LNFIEFEIGSYVLVEHVQNKLRRGPNDKLLPFLKGPYKVIGVNGNVYRLRNLVTQRERDYHVKRLHEYNYDPMTISPLKVACKDGGDIFPIETIERISGSVDRKDSLRFLVKWIGYENPTWEPWKNIRNTIAMRDFLMKQKNKKYHQLIPKNIRYYDSDEEEEEEEEEKAGLLLGEAV